MSKKRVRPLPAHRTLRLTKKRLKQPKSLPSPVALLKDAFRLLSSNKKLFGGLVLINAALTLIFVKGLGSSFDVLELKNEIEDVVGGGSSQITTAFTLFGYLLGSAGSSANESSGAYQLFVTLLTSLAAIWAVRQLLADQNPRIRDTYYKGMYPIVPFLLVLFIVGLQLIPLLLGNLLYSTVTQNGLIVSALEQIVWLLLFIGLAVLSGYMLTSSLFALYISTLPDVAPLQALRSARELVLHRRLSVWLRLVFLILFLLLVSFAIFIPMLIWLPVLAQIIFTLASSLALVFVHMYMYLLYRSLL